MPDEDMDYETRKIDIVQWCKERKLPVNVIYDWDTDHDYIALDVVFMSEEAQLLFELGYQKPTSRIIKSRVHHEG